MIKSWKRYINENIQISNIKVVYKRVSESYGDRKSLFNAILHKLNEKGIRYKYTNSSISFNLCDTWWNLEADFNILRDGNSGSIDHTLTVEYNSKSPHKDVIDYFRSMFSEVSDSKEIEYEDGFQPYNPSTEFWIKQIV